MRQKRNALVNSLILLLFFKVLLQFFPLPSRIPDRIVAISFAVVFSAVFFGVLANKRWAYLLGIMASLVDLSAAAWAGGIFGVAISIYDITLLFYCVRGDSRLIAKYSKRRKPARKGRR